MSRYSRRGFLRSSALAFSAAALARPATLLAQATGAAAPIYDLVIKGGEVLDPSQKLRGRRDIGIRYAAIAARRAGHPGERAARSVLDGGRQAGAAGPRRPARACLPRGLGDRPAGRRAGAAHRAPPPMSARAMPAATTSPRFKHCGDRPESRTPHLRLRAHLEHRPGRLPGRRDAQHRLRQRRRWPPRRSPRTPTSARRQGARDARTWSAATASSR